MTVDLRTLHYVTPGGVSCILVAGGATVAMRQHTVHLDQPWGVLEELERGLAPVPWASSQERAAALSWLSSAPWIDDGLRERLTRHVRSTPVYDWGTQA
ncbi:MAG: hypothetical protein V4753_04395 [Pseudomonadota bacterium]